MPARRSKWGTSLEPGLFGPGDIAGEPLVRRPPFQVAAQDALDVVGHLVGRDLQATELPAERRLRTEMPPEVDLEPLDLVTVVVAHDGALEPDVGGLEPRARVGAAVDVDRQRLVELR